MRIELHEITIRELFDGFEDNGEDGVFGYGGKLNIRPSYQRELVYPDNEQREVVYSIQKDYPLNVMYWIDNGDGTYELLDGQQRTLSICRYLTGDLPIKDDTGTGSKFFGNFPKEEREKFLDYKLMIYFCSGTTRERIEWFRIINIAGEKLTDQEVRNANFNGPWVTAAKRVFSKRGCYAYKLGGDYMDGTPIRQEYLETVLKWACDRDGVKNDGDIDAIDVFMGMHQNDTDAEDLKTYFTNVIEWVQSLFPDYNSKMKGLPWGIWYNEYHDNEYDMAYTKKRAGELMDDPEVTKYTGVYPYILGGETDEKLLSLRQFDEPTKRAKFKAQKGICPMCGKKFSYKNMQGDHITPWSKGGTTTLDNCQMLCAKCNLIKSATEAEF